MPRAVLPCINKDFDLWGIDLSTRRLRRLTSGPGPEVSPRFAPGGRRLVCLSVPRKGSHRDVFNLAVVTLGESGPRTSILFDHHGPGADHPPHPAPSFPLPEDCWDGDNRVVYSAEVGVRTEIVRVDLRTGKGTPLKRADEDSGLTSVVGRSKRQRQMTPAGNLFLRQRPPGDSRRLEWDHGDG